MSSLAIELQVNGEPVFANVPPGLSLLRFLRDELRLTGTKDGCSEGHCGTCMVLVDGQPTRSCLVTVDEASGKHVTTIEGITWDGELHPFQKALIETSAVQCGFCIPGVVMSGVALLSRIPDPAPEEIKDALRLNLCRCGGYLKIIQAVQQAAQVMSGKSQPQPDRRYVGRVVGQSVPDKEGVEKVTGRLTFADDMHPEGMLHGKVLWSQYPHARILSTDTSSAQKLPGVVAVLTAADVPGRNGFGDYVPNHPVLCHDKVRYLGDAVAVVFAETLTAAERGRDAIRVEYQELEVVSTPQLALKPDAPQVQEGGNACHHILREVGDVEQGFRQAAAIVEEDFTTPFVEHAYLEPESGLGVPMPDGRVAVYTPTQKPVETRAQIAASLGVAEDRVRVVSTPLGGGFGGKGTITVQILVALGAVRTGRPCKITLTRQESLTLSIKRHAFSLHYKVGAKGDGMLTAVEARMVCDAGPSTMNSNVTLRQSCQFACGPYVVPNARIEGWAAFTNNADGGAFRGMGVNQPTFALESCLDMLARKLEIDPFELRLRNALGPGKCNIHGEVLRASAPLKETILAARDALARTAVPRSKGKKRIGVGMASGSKNVGRGMGIVDDATAIVELTADGDVLVRVSTVDMGQGNRTAIAQIAAEALGINYGRIKLVTGDTDLVGKGMGGNGERQTFVGGNAVLGACRQFNDILLSYVARQYGMLPANLSVFDEAVLEGSKPVVTLGDLGRFTAGEGEVLRAEHYYVAPKTYPTYSERYNLEDIARTRPKDYRNYSSYAYATVVAVVEVDEGSGKVRVLKLIAAHDVGRAVNPAKIEGQLEGSCLMGLGYALSEQYRVKKGIHLTKSLGQCRIPTFRDVPEIECIIIEDPEPDGPMGAKGVAEAATLPSTPAIINAIFDAVGVRITDLPATKDRILTQLGTLRTSGMEEA